MKRLVIATILTLVVLLAPASASAHGAIFTYKYIDGDNLILVTHNVHDAEAGMPITYNLRLYTMDGQLIPFERVEARVLHDARSVHRQVVSGTSNNDANFTYTYPKQGAHVLSFNFLDHDKNIAHGEFPIKVAAGLDDSFFSKAFSLQTALAFVLGLGLGAFAFARRKYLLNLPKQIRKKRS